MAVTTFVIFSGLLAAAAGEIVTIEACPRLPQDMCTVHQVRINPCVSGKHCGLRKGTNVTMEFDFTPSFSTNKLYTEVYYPSSAGDMQFAGLTDHDACKLTSCPTVPGQQQVLSYTLYIGKKLPTGIFPFEWKVQNEDNDKEVCCFKVTIMLKKPKSS